MTKEEKNAYMKEYQKRWRKEHPETIKKYHKKYYDSHKEEVNEYNRKYYKNNKDKLLDYAREYQKEHPEANKKSHENFTKTHDWVKYCSEARRKRVAKMKEQGILNPYDVINKRVEPKYKERSESNE